MNSMAKKKLLLIGAGKMGFALLTGWLKEQLSPENIIVLEPMPSADLMSQGVMLNPAMADIIAFKPDLIVLGVKPQIAENVLSELRDCFAPNSLILSIMAGLSLERLRQLTQHDALIRAMPNTAISLGASATVLVASPRVTQAQKQLAEDLMSAVGMTAWLDDEALMDAVTAISGSGPAYVFHFVEALASAGQKLGLEADFSLQLARQTVIGAGRMLDEFEAAATDLRENVTSPNGTTQAALNVLMSADGLGELMEKTTLAAAKRSKALSKE